jgi:hypothetical protein
MQLKRKIHKWLLMPLVWKYLAMPGSSCGFDEAQSETEREIEANLRAHVEMLASRIGERHKGVPQQLTRTRAYIAERLRESGRDVREHRFADGVNLVAGDGDIIVGAHFDTVPGSPGANDNASGIAVMLELARLLPDSRLRFVGFDNEEHVGQPATAMGSYCYAQECSSRAEKISGMWSLETLGCYLQEAGSQRYPQPFDMFYPTIGNFVAFVGNDASRDWVRRCVREFRRAGAFPCEGLAAPSKYADIDRSDQWGFWQFGYPALMVTDTAEFRYAAYHTPQDTPEKLNYRALARVTRVLGDVLREITP